MMLFFEIPLCSQVSTTPWVVTVTIGRRPLGSRGSIMEPIRPLRLSKITERCSRKIRSWPDLIHLDHQPNVISIMTPYNSRVAAVGDICIYRKQFVFCTHSALQLTRICANDTQSNGPMCQWPFVRSSYAIGDPHLDKWMKRWVHHGLWVYTSRLKANVSTILRPHEWSLTESVLSRTEQTNTAML